METDKKIINIYMKQVGEVDLLTPQEEKELLLKTKGEDKEEAEVARGKLIRSNLRLVIKIAKAFQNIGLDYEDLINEGNIGLMVAIDKYDPSRGAKLSYYASFWIKQYIRRAISNKGRTIRLPVGVVELKLKIQKFIESYEKAHSKAPSKEQISKGLDIPLKKVNKILKLELQSESLNRIVSNNDNELINILVNEAASSPVSSCVDTDDKNVLSSFLDILDRRQRYIIIHRYGLDGSRPETLETIGKEFDLTRERIRQLELTALRSLREMYKKIDFTTFNK